jgi:acyl dehydratase
METAIEQWRNRIGEEVGLSYWLTIDQAMIDAFADATGDHQYIHVDPARAAAGPLGGTVAHGFLSLSLCPKLRMESPGARPEGIRMALNYGGDRLRFLQPVRSGARVRLRTLLLDFAPRGNGWLERVEYRLEIEGEERPALIAEWLALYLL